MAKIHIAVTMFDAKIDAYGAAVIDVPDKSWSPVNLKDVERFKNFNPTSVAGFEVASDAGRFGWPSSPTGGILTKRHDEEGNDITYLNAVAKYWVEHYVGIKGRCKVCDNAGTFAVHDGSRTFDYCFCPNGQKLRHLKVKL